jgi:hypothetical protein
VVNEIRVKVEPGLAFQALEDDGATPCGGGEGERVLAGYGFTGKLLGIPLGSAGGQRDGEQEGLVFPNHAERP